MRLDGAALYRSACEEASARVLRRYSTSFSLATALLGTTERAHVANIYALVRIADEVVDGVCAELGLGSAAIRTQLDDLEGEVRRACELGFSTNPVVHAFATTARHTGIGADAIDPFFASMRMDLERSTHTADSFATYVHGSAEVVGVMCVRAFFDGAPPPPAELAELDAGARRLGAAFQKVNFLRDLGGDSHELGRAYFPGLDPTALTAGQMGALLDDIDADLAAALAIVPRLPESSRHAVRAAHDLFAALAEELRAVPPARALAVRTSVPARQKARIVARCAAARATGAVRRRGRP